MMKQCCVNKLRSLSIKSKAAFYLMRVKLAFRNFETTPPIIIYQMGKAGSTAVYRSLKKKNIVNPRYHVHFLSHRNMGEVEQYYRSVDARNEMNSLRFCRLLRHKVDRIKKPVYLISIVRDPVAREISDVFQNMKVHHKDLLTDSGECDVKKTIQFLMDKFYLTIYLYKFFVSCRCLFHATLY